MVFSVQDLTLSKWPSLDVGSGYATIRCEGSLCIGTHFARSQCKWVTIDRSIKPNIGRDYCFIVRRQTVLFSATQTRNVEDLARVSLKKSPRYVGVDDHRETSTVEGLEQVNIGRHLESRYSLRH